RLSRGHRPLPQTKSERQDGTRERVSDESACGQGKEPCPDDTLNDSPFHSAKTFHDTHAHDRSGDHVRGGKRNAVIACCLNDHRGACLCRESMHRLQFHHAMAKRANDSPAARGCSHCHGRGAETYYPRGQHENWRFKKTQPARQMIEAARFCARKKSECNDAHGFLRVIAAVAMRHPRRAKNLQFTKKRLHKMGRETLQRYEQQEHQQSAENKTCDWGCNHGHNNFRPHTRVPFYDRPTTTCGGQPCSAKSTNGRMTRAR